MKYLILSLLSLSLIGCGEDLSSWTEPELQPYKDTFLQEAASYGISLKTSNLEMRLGQTREGVAGVCTKVEKHFLDGGGIQKSITISRSYWEAAPEFVREFVVFHELGHCLLDQGHDTREKVAVRVIDEDRVYTTTVEPSYMSTSINRYRTPVIYEKLRQYYLDELFMGADLTNSDDVEFISSSLSKASNREDHALCDHNQY